MLVVETILGALTGYLTNDIAIRQLFSKNGIVVRERDQFIELLVRVLKEQVLSDDIIIAMRDHPDIVELFDEGMKRLLEKKLIANLSHVSLADFDEAFQLKKMLLKHLKEINFSELEIDTVYLYQFIAKSLKKNEFKETFLKFLQNIGTMSIEECGVKEIYENIIFRFRTLSDAEWKKFLDKQQQHLFIFFEQYIKSLSSDDVSQIIEKYQLSGIQLINWLSTRLKNSFLDAKRVLHNEIFQESLYEWINRLTPELIELYFQSLLDIFYPFIKEERFNIEQMIKESIKEADPYAAILNETALGMVERFFADDKQGNDWVTVQYLKYSDESEQRRVCDKISLWVKRLFLSKIDNWRHEKESDFFVQNLLFSDEVKKIFAGLIDMLLEYVRKNPLILSKIAEYIIALFFGFAKTHCNVTVCCERLDVVLKKWWGISIAECFLTQDKQESLYQSFVDWWQRQGEECLKKLEQQVIMQPHLKAALIETSVEKIYKTPLAHLLEQIVDNISIDILTYRVRMMIFSYIGDFLAIMTRKQLEQLSREDIRRLTLDMIGKEMRPLSYLGGAIGAAAGAATSIALQVGGTQASAAEMENLTLLLAVRSGMYGAVGYGTNVMAIKSLFWPYHKMLGWQGLISANQQRFAHKMKALTSDYVINGTIWETQVQKVSDLYEEHHVQWINLAFHTMDKKRETYLKPYYHSFLSHQVSHLCKGILYKKGYSLLLSPIVKNALLADVHCRIYGWLEEKNSIFIPRTLSKVYHLEYESGFFSKEIWRYLQRIDERKCHYQLMEVLNEVKLPTSKQFYEKLWKVFIPLYEKIPNKLLENKDEWIEKIDHKIYKRLSFPLQLTYRMMNGKKYIEKVMLYFIKNKLPYYMENKKMEIQPLVVNWGMIQFSSQPLLSCVYPVSQEEIKYLKEVIHTFSEEQIQHIFLNTVAKIGRMDPAKYQYFWMYYKHWINKGLFYVLKKIVGSAQTKEMFHSISKATERSWHSFCNDIAQMMSDVSIARAMSMSDEAFWHYLNTIADFNKQEKTEIIEVAHRILTSLEPMLFSYVLEQGQRFIDIVDVPQLAYQSVCDLSPESLEVLVREIAQPYFTHVERMGWFGAVVAIPATAISIALGNV